MKSKNLTYTGIVALILGVLLIFMKSAAISAVVMVMGVFFLIAAILNVYFAFRKYSSPFVPIITALGSLALGLWLLFDPDGFTEILVYVFAGLMILEGLYHICLLTFVFKDSRFPFAFYILPILLILSGVVIIFIGSERMMNLIVLVTGIALIVHAICCFIDVAGESSYRRIEKEP